MLKVLLILGGIILLILVGVLGYLWYLTKNSPSVVHGGYDQKMQDAPKEQTPGQ